MKKLVIAFCSVLTCAAAFAQAPAAAAQPAPATASVQKEAPDWPVWLAFNSTKDIDVAGLRLTLPYGECESVTGFDLGCFGRCRYFEGFQINILRNDAKEYLAGLQIGLYNSAGRADRLGMQIGLWNEARIINGFQIGLVNLTDSGSGFQIGLINRAETFYGFQGGAVNVIRENEFAFLPLINVGWDLWTDPRF